MSGRARHFASDALAYFQVCEVIGDPHQTREIYERALPIAKRMTELSRDRTFNGFWYALALYRVGRFRAAAERLEEFDSAEALAVRAMALHRDGQHERATELVRKFDQSPSSIYERSALEYELRQAGLRPGR